MANINKVQIQLIVENALRKNGLGGWGPGANPNGDMEAMWKTTVNGMPSPVNLQNLRDALTDVIVDSLSKTVAIGTPSTGDVVAPNTWAYVSQSPELIITGSPIPVTANLTNACIEITRTTDPVFFTFLDSLGTNPYPADSISGKLS